MKHDPWVLDAHKLTEESHAFIFTKSVNKCFRISKERIFTQALNLLGVSMKKMRLVLNLEKHIRLIQTVKRKVYTKIRQMV